MSGYVLHPAAFADLDDIRQHIAADNPAAADRTVNDIFEAIRTLVTFPHLGFRRPNLTTRPVRFKLVQEYVIAYVPDEAPLRVLAVFHGRRSPRVMAAILRGRESAPGQPG